MNRSSFTIWDNSNIVESYSGVTTPLTFSFAREIYEHVYREFCRIMGVREHAIVVHDEVFGNMLGLVRGRMYYNLLNWHRMLALLPGYRANRRFMEQMMGVKEPLPEEFAREIEARAAPGRGRALWPLARTIAALLVNHLTIDRQVKSFFELVRQALALPDPPLAARTSEELVAHYRELRGKLLHNWHAPIVNDFFAMLHYGLLRRLTTRWLKDPDGALQNDLIGGDGGIVSAEPAVRMQQLACLALPDPVLVEVLSTGTIDEILAAIEQHPRFAEEFRAYLEKFGERTVNELKLESATLHDDPLPLLHAVGNLARQLRDAHVASHGSPGDRLRLAAQRRAESALARQPFRRVVFNWVLTRARRRVRDRENLRLERTRLFGRVRRIFLELGRRLQAAGVLDDARDVLYLEVDEVLEFVEGRSTCTDLRGLAAVRKREFAAFQGEPAPSSRFESRGIVYLSRVPESPALKGWATTAACDERRGLGCSPGVVRGRVRIVRDPSRINLTERAILVAEFTDPGWITLFPSALGLLVERGSLLSHAAIVSRELGIPAVIAVSGVTHWLQDGELVEMDGSTGVIRRLAAAPEELDVRCA